MKKAIYYLLILGATLFTSCDPMDEIYDDIDANGGIEGVDFISGSLDYTLTEDDYELVATEIDSVEYFASEELAQEVIPIILASTHPVLGEGSLINVTYDLFSPSEVETLSTSETLSNVYGIDDYLSTSYETASEGTFVALTYNAAVDFYTLTSDDFVTIGNALSSKYPDAADSASSFSNFERREDNDSYWSNSMIVEGLSILFGDDYTSGEVLSVSFAIYNGSSGTESLVVQYNGYSFLELEDVTVDVADALGTEYTFTGDDYDTVGTELASTYPEPAASVGSYSNFERRTDNDAYWSDDMILEAVNLVLPASTEGDIYVVTYDIYNGSAVTETITLEYSSGVYIYSDIVSEESTAEIEAIVAKNNGEWEFPYLVTESDYELLDLSYGNFDSSSIYKLEIFLKSLLPYAQSGDTVSVQYEYYDGSTNEKYSIANFDGTNWSIPEDVEATTFQYGFEDGEWLPDNTIVYTLLSADYTLIADAFSDVYPDATGSVANYSNFDRRVGNAAEWTDEMLVEAFNVLLDSIDPSAEEGQKYDVVFVIYNGSTTAETFSLIKTGGVWVDNN
ncbi:hypothetical protein [Cellulophaga sp. L1A9]|uniref:hypothetical protein n=1 Tax=Cellulophaga sp. L1A9 TaxID=2686362 RepID=UPI00131D1246|nr:hypothetical protein [Cellulophaga sp. L1A9]